MNKVITTKTYFLIWLTAIVIFVFQTALTNWFSKTFFGESFLTTVFFSIYLVNILAGVVTFIFGLVSLFTKNKNASSSNLNDKKMLSKDKPKTFLLITSFIVFILSIIFLLLSNNPLFTGDTTQFLRLIILAFFSFISLVSFIAYLTTYPDKLIKKYSSNKEKHSFAYWIGNFMISGLLATFLSVLFFFIIIPFMQAADGLSFAEKAKIGGINMWRVVIMYGLLTAVMTYFCFHKKLYKSLAVILILFWIIGSVFVTYLNTTGQNVSLNNFNSSEYITNRNSCNKELVLQESKNCILRVLRDDGGHGTGFAIKPGYLITNKHVIEGANKLSVWINRERDIQVWNYSPVLDIAILKLPDDTEIPTCKWFDSRQLNIAEELYTFGWPNDPTGDSTVTKGVYSRTNKYEDGTEDIQTDAPINPGNSGGPLVNECGVVGINTLRVDWSQEQSPRVIEGMSLALSSNFVHSKIDELISSGSLAKGIPNVSNYQTNISQPNSKPTYTLDVNDIKVYLNDIYRAKSSWEQARGYVDGQKLNNLIDSFNRQIDFCNHLINKLSNGQRASGDDINLWNAVIKMGNESADLSYELNNR